jgi:hypothetical protein
MDDFLFSLPANVPWIVSNDRSLKAVNFRRLDAVLHSPLGDGGALLYTKRRRPMDPDSLYHLLLRCKYLWTDFTRDEFVRNVLTPIFHTNGADADFIRKKFGVVITTRASEYREAYVSPLLRLPYDQLFLS